MDVNMIIQKMESFFESADPSELYRIAIEEYGFEEEMDDIYTSSFMNVDYSNIIARKVRNTILKDNVSNKIQYESMNIEYGHAGGIKIENILSDLNSQYSVDCSKTSTATAA